MKKILCEVAALGFFLIYTHQAERDAERRGKLTAAVATLYLIGGFTVMGGSRHRHQSRPVLQKHLPLTHITPDPECCQIHSQVVLLSLKETHTHAVV